MAPHRGRSSHRRLTLFASILALACLGCDSGPGSGPSAPMETDPACEGAMADAVADGGTWAWCDGSGSYGLCALHFESGQRVAVCDDSLCVTYQASARGWVEEWTGEIVGDCLEPEAGQRVVIF